MRFQTGCCDCCCFAPEKLSRVSFSSTDAVTGRGSAVLHCVCVCVLRCCRQTCFSLELAAAGRKISLACDGVRERERESECAAGQANERKRSWETSRERVRVEVLETDRPTGPATGRETATSQASQSQRREPSLSLSPNHQMLQAVACKKESSLLVSRLYLWQCSPSRLPAFPSFFSGFLSSRHESLYQFTIFASSLPSSLAVGTDTGAGRGRESGERRTLLREARVLAVAAGAKQSRAKASKW